MLPSEYISRHGDYTDAPPGSQKKIKILMERAARKEPLFHPMDNTSLVTFGEEDDPDDDPLEYMDIDLAG